MPTKLIFVGPTPPPNSGADIPGNGPHTPATLDQNFANLQATADAVSASVATKGAAHGYVLGMPGFETLTAAVATLAGGPGTVYMATSQVLAASLNTGVMEIVPENGATITTTGYTLTYPGSTARWPMAQVFAGTGAVTGLKEARPEWFGTNTTPGTTDMTAAILAAAAGVKESKGELVLTGVYAVTDLHLVGCINYSIRSVNAELKGIASFVKAAVITIDNALSFNMYGKLKINGNGNTNYTSGMLITTSATAEPLLNPVGQVTRVNIRDVMFYSCKIALKIGSYNVDSQLAEIVFNNLEMLICPGAVHIGGSQTGAAFTGCNLVSEPNPAFAGVEEYLIKNEGSFVSVTGGECALAAGSMSGSAAFWMHPSQSTMYQNPYGAIRVVGTHLETGATPMLQIYNPRAIATPTSVQSHFSVSNSGGYIGDNPTGTVVLITDTSYIGKFQAKGNNFYIGIAGTPRAAYTIDNTGGLAVIDIDKTSFGWGFLNWMGGVKGGLLLHDMLMVSYVDTLASQSVAAGATDTLKFTYRYSPSSFNRLNANYSATTGVFTVPAGGAKELRIVASGQAVSGAPTGEFQVYKNGVADVAGYINGALMHVDANFADVGDNTTFEIKFHNTSGGAVVFGVSGIDRMQIFMQN